MFPNDSRPQIARASQFLARGDVTGAEREAQAALAAFGHKCGEAVFLMGLVRATQQRLPEAVALMEKALPRLQPHAALHFSYGRALVLTGQGTRAIAEFQAAVRLEPRMVEAWYALGGQQAQSGRFVEAETSFRRVLMLAPGHGETGMALGATLLELERFADAEMVLSETLRGAHPPAVVAGLAQNLAQAQLRNGKREAALASLALAQSSDPALRLEERKGDILVDLRRFEEALAAYRAALDAAPRDQALHKKYNDLLYQLGREKDAGFLASYDRVPGDDGLQASKAGFLLMLRRDDEAHRIFSALLARQPGDEHACIGAANALNMMARHDEAERIIRETLSRLPDSAVLYNMLASTALFRRDPEQAAAMAQEALRRAPYSQYALANLGTAWRLMDDERDEALNGYDRFVRVFDLEPPDGFSNMEDFHAQLRAELDGLHPPTREFLDQSLRGGTQTRGALFGAGHKMVEALKRRIDSAVRDYIAGLDADADHPLQSRRAAGFTYSGSWSSRLRDNGFHVNHIHPEGWISSCYYVEVPDAARDAEAKQGWFKVGEPRFDHGLSWRRAIQPVPGRLVLFPSYMWHGTIAFQAPSNRTTIAFDVVPTR